MDETTIVIASGDAIAAAGVTVSGWVVFAEDWL